MRRQDHPLRLLDHAILTKGRHEHAALNFLLETWRDAFQQVLELLLLCHCLLDSLEVLSDVFSEVFLELHVVHGRVGSVKDALELAFFGVCGGKQDSQLSEDVTVEDGSNQIDRHAEEELT